MDMSERIRQAPATQLPEPAPVAMAELLDAALDSYPMTALPPGFMVSTLARLGPAPAPALAGPRLRLLDVALPLAVAGLALMALVILAVVSAADPALPLRLHAMAREVWAALLPGVPAPGVAVAAYGAAFIGMALLGAVTLLDRGGGTQRV